MKLPMICAVLTATLTLSNCAEMKAGGDAGCLAYGEARGAMPTGAADLPDPWLGWVSATDTRMTATCR